MNYSKTLFATSMLSLLHQTALAKFRPAILEPSTVVSSIAEPVSIGTISATPPISVFEGCAGGQFTGPAYQSQTAEEKLHQLWDKCQADTTFASQDWAALPDLFLRDMNVSFDLASDELPVGRPKVNHSQGTLTWVAWEDVGGHPFTGIYEGGSSLGLLRMSEGNFLVPEADGLTPTIGLKFLRDGMESVNHVANTDWGPSGSYNFMANEFKTHIGNFHNKCEVKTIERKFLEVTDRVGSVGLAEFSRVNVDGSVVPDIWFPFNLKFVPHPDVASMWPDSGKFDMWGDQIPFYEQLMSIPAGTVLFEVVAQEEAEPCRRDGTHNGDPDLDIEDVVPWIHIANIIAKTETTTCQFGDRCLFFKHERTDLDFEERPDFEEASKCSYNGGGSGSVWGMTPVLPFPTDQTTAKAWVRGQLNDHACPFAWLLSMPFTPIF